jgi:hypothetical protein
MALERIALQDVRVCAAASGFAFKLHRLHKASRSIHLGVASSSEQANEGRRTLDGAVSAVCAESHIGC